MRLSLLAATVLPLVSSAALLSTATEAAAQGTSTEIAVDVTARPARRARPVQVRRPPSATRTDPAPSRVARVPVRRAASPRIAAAPVPAPGQAQEGGAGGLPDRGAGAIGGPGQPTPLGGQLPVPLTRRQETQSVSVVDRQQIEERNPSGANDILRGVPGVSISRSGGLGGQPYVRGFNSNDFRVPLFVDGDRFRGRNTLQFIFFPPDEIERVEVIRGPASSLYGSEALAGLINIVTRRADVAIDGPFRLQGGGYSVGFGSAARSLSANGFVEAGGDGFDLRASVTGRRGDDYDTPRGRIRNSDYETFGGSLKLGYSPDASQRFELTLRDEDVTDGRAGGTGGAPGFPRVRARENTLQFRQARLAYSGDFAGTLFQHAEASFYANEFYTKLGTLTANSATQATLANSYVYGPLVLGGRALATANWGDGVIGPVKTTIGFDIFDEERPGAGASSVVYRLGPTGALAPFSGTTRTVTNPLTSQTDVGAFLYNEWTPIPALTLSSAGRVDWINTRTALSPLPSPNLLSAFAAKADVDRVAPTGGGGVVFRLLPIVDLFANVATSYRAPANAQLFAGSVQGAGFVVPNPDLKPETGVTYEGGFRLHTAEGSVSFTAFHSDYRDLILNRQVRYLNTASTQAQNIGCAEIEGIEVEGRIQVTPTLNLFGAATTLSGTRTDVSPRVPLPYIAPLYGRIGVQYVPEDRSYSVIASVDLAASKRRIDPTQEYPTGGYAVVNLFARLDLAKLISPSLGRTELFLGVENLLDVSYRSASTFASVAFARNVYNPLLEPGRNLTAKLTHRF